MGDISKYLVYVVNVGRRNDKSRRSYVSFSDVYFEIDFTKACSSKLFISLSNISIFKSWSYRCEEDMFVMM